MPNLKKRMATGALLAVMAVWGVHLGYNLNFLQNVRWAFLGYTVPIYFFFVVALVSGAGACALTSKSEWTLWEILWCALPLVCVPGILRSADPVWSLRQWISWCVRGVIPGGVIFLTARRKMGSALLLYWIYPVIIVAALVGLKEIHDFPTGLWDRSDYYAQGGIVGTSQPSNPFYRPQDQINSRLVPRGTQGNRIPYASTLVGFFPIGLWLLKYKRRLWPVNLVAMGILGSLLILAQVRSAWLGLLAAITLIPLIGLQRNRREIVKLAAGAVLILSGLMAWPASRDLLWTRVNSFHLSQSSIHERLAVWHAGAILRDHGLIGVGFGQFPTTCRSYYPTTMVWYGTPDNQYLRWAIENGVPSALMLAAFLVGLILVTWKKIQCMENLQEADFYKSILVGWLSVAVTFLFFDGFYWGACDMTFWSLLALYATCLRPDSAVSYLRIND